MVETGAITGTTTDVAPGTDVVLTITGKDADGNNVTITKTVTTDASGNYSSAVTVADGIVDGSGVNVVANTTDRNGQGVGPATDSIAAQGDNDTDPTTPEDTGLDLVTGAITVDIVETGAITGTTTDVAPGTDVVLTITGKDADGNNVTITKTVTTDASGNYSSAVTVADGIVDGSGVNVVANTTDRNGQGVGPATDSIAAQGDNDTDPTTPEDTGLDLVTGAITVDINDTDSTQIMGTTEDVAPNSKVTLEITSIDENGETRTFTEEVFTNADGEYSYTLTPAQGNATEVVAKVDDRNGNELQDNDLLDAVIKADSKTEVNNGDNAVTGTSGNDVLAGDIGGLKTNFEVGHNYNISIILDISGSMGNTMTNGKTRLEVAKTALQAFVDQMAQHDGIINLRITTFGSNATAIIQDVVVNNGTITSIKSTISQITTSGATYPETAFTDVDNWLISKTNGYENQIYYLTDGAPSNTNVPSRDTTFESLANQSKIFAVGVGTDVPLTWVERYDNTDVNGSKIDNWSPTNHGDAQKLGDADKLIAYLIGGSENFIPADVGNDVVKGGEGEDILFGDSMNTNWISGLDPLLYPQYSGYPRLIAKLKSDGVVGADGEPTQQQVYDYVKANYREFIAADAADSATKGGNDTIYGGSGDDIIIAGAGNDIVYGGSGNDIISTGRGDDTIMYDVLNAADATAGNGTDTWVDYEANDKIEFAADFFDGLLADQSNLGDYITVIDDGNGNAVIQVDRDGNAGTHTMSDLLIIENQAGLGLQDLIDNNQLVIG
ncbi:VWA domain-containing protein [Acinetobacter tandoii]|nr:VWA domain-containing protein [Acinetobacter tandoii]